MSAVIKLTIRGFGNASINPVAQRIEPTELKWRSSVRILAGFSLSYKSITKSYRKQDLQLN